MELIIVIIALYGLMHLLTSGSNPPTVDARMHSSDEDVLKQQLSDLWIGQNR